MPAEGKGFGRRVSMLVSFVDSRLLSGLDGHSLLVFPWIS